MSMHLLMGAFAIATLVGAITTTVAAHSIACTNTKVHA